MPTSIRQDVGADVNDERNALLWVGKDEGVTAEGVVPSAAMEEPVTSPEKASGCTLVGKCLCDAVHYAVADEFVYAANCHCSNCRRATGSAFKPFAGIARDKLGITKGEDNLMIFG